MIGSGELLVILCIMLLLFGGKRLPELAKNLGRGIREFKNACNEDASFQDEIIVQPKVVRTEDNVKKSDDES